MKKPRTPAYQFTVDTLSAFDMIKLADFRKSIAQVNKNLKGLSDKGFKITLHGRGPRIPAAVQNFYQDNPGAGRTVLGRILQFQRELPVKYAKTIDVYLHTRS